MRKNQRDGRAAQDLGENDADGRGLVVTVREICSAARRNDATGNELLRLRKYNNEKLVDSVDDLQLTVVPIGLQMLDEIRQASCWTDVVSDPPNSSSNPSADVTSCFLARKSLVAMGLPDIRRRLLELIVVDVIPADWVLSNKRRAPRDWLSS